jgi:hypothetical protein
MNPERDDFEPLRRLLAVKRHEQPPPGYFDGFSRQVIVRIQAGDRAEGSAFDRLFGEPLWLQRLLGAFETKPLVAGSFGLVVCGFLMTGVLLSENVDNAGAAFVPAPNPMPGLATWRVAQSGTADETTPIALVGTNRAVGSPLEDSLFRQLQFKRTAVATPVGFELRR